MKYNPTTTPIPKERRADINAKIISLLESGQMPAGITAEDIYNGYTGVGGLHGLDRSQFENYFKYAEGKKEMNYLRLNWDKAAHLLSWKPMYSWSEAINKTVDWFKNYEKNPQDTYPFCAKQIQEYMRVL